MMKNGLLTIGLCAAALGMIGLMSGCTSKKSASNGGGDGDYIYVGMVASKTGELVPWGADSIKGAELALKIFNEKGGVNGKEVRLRIEDSASKPEDGKSATQKLATTDVVAIIGEVASGITLQMRTVTVPEGIPLVAIGATNPKVTENSNGLVSRVCYTDDLQGPVMAVFAYKDQNLRRVAVLTDNKQPYSQGLSEAFIKKFKELGGEIVTEQFYESGQTQFTSQITQIKSFAPDGIFMSGYFNEVGPMARQIEDAGMGNAVLMGGDGWDSTQLVASGGDAIIGGFFCNHYSNDDTRPQVAEFLKVWKAEYPDENGGMPATTMGALAYDAMMLVCDALTRAETVDRAGVAKAISDTVGFEGVSGTINLKGNNGDPPKRAIVVSVEQDGYKFVKAYEASEVQ